MPKKRHFFVICLYFMSDFFYKTGICSEENIFYRLSEFDTDNYYMNDITAQNIENVKDQPSKYCCYCNPMYNSNNILESNSEFKDNQQNYNHNSNDCPRQQLNLQDFKNLELLGELKSQDNLNYIPYYTNNTATNEWVGSNAYPNNYECCDNITNNGELNQFSEILSGYSQIDMQHLNDFCLSNENKKIENNLDRSTIINLNEKTRKTPSNFFADNHCISDSPFDENIFEFEKMMQSNQQSCVSKNNNFNSSFDYLNYQTDVIQKTGVSTSNEPLALENFYNPVYDQSFMLLNGKEGSCSTNYNISNGSVYKTNTQEKYNQNLAILNEPQASVVNNNKYEIKSTDQQKQTIYSNESDLNQTSKTPNENFFMCKGSKRGHFIEESTAKKKKDEQEYHKQPILNDIPKLTFDTYIIESSNNNTTFITWIKHNIGNLNFLLVNDNKINSIISKIYQYLNKRIATIKFKKENTFKYTLKSTSKNYLQRLDYQKNKNKIACEISQDYKQILIANEGLKIDLELENENIRTKLHTKIFYFFSPKDEVHETIVEKILFLQKTINDFGYIFLDVYCFLVDILSLEKFEDENCLCCCLSGLKWLFEDLKKNSFFKSEKIVVIPKLVRVNDENLHIKLQKEFKTQIFIIRTLFLGVLISAYKNDHFFVFLYNCFIQKLLKFFSLKSKFDKKNKELKFGYYDSELKAFLKTICFCILNKNDELNKTFAKFYSSLRRINDYSELAKIICK